ncbi:aspartate--tRNA ligase [Candidatus Persebacteraceae bacterium Df01]|uniref:Aspartate--tRNA(Asp/Asn) ligase n=1 Tax=Candidatus Doriopsillibacter californiensis TaxID=2970740 RepID=A0ABT7QLX7_9GAMM|nr:aspartate--tRNA ligase [Candidatus Persebacteraceae bacterium Df01]
MRTHFCGAVNTQNLDGTVTVCGWAHSRRDHGGVIFIDLRDKSGVLQLVADPSENADVFAQANGVRNEYVLRATGIVRRRPEGTDNSRLSSGEVEVNLCRLEVLNTATALPFMPDDEGVSEEARLRHRVIDLRGTAMQSNLRRRHAMLAAVRQWFCERDFIDIETPLLTRTTPEGARDFLVPSRLQPDAFYALPQSPQLFKQMLMAAGFERYFQIARCFRDEDSRSDRQPEFSQIDVEMSFVEENDVMTMMEELVIAAFAAVNITLPQPFPRMNCTEAVRRFGIDRPDLRNPLELTDLGDLMAEVEFKVFREPAQAADGRVAALRLPGGASLSRKQIDELTAYVARYGARGLAYIKVINVTAGADGLQSPIIKFLPENVLAQLIERTQAVDGDIIFFGAGREDIVNASLAALRDRLGEDGNLLSDGWKPLWITDFPLFERDYERKRWNARHHPFTAPREGDERHLPEHPERVMSRAYDMTLNGVEIGGGSIRIHRVETQLAMLEALGIDETEARRQFGFLLQALESGAPPHGGVAFGLDRMAAMACQVQSIRDVIAFPKTQRGQCLLTKAPSSATSEQLQELHIKVAKRASPASDSL